MTLSNKTDRAIAEQIDRLIATGEALHAGTNHSIRTRHRESFIPGLNTYQTEHIEGDFQGFLAWQLQCQTVLADYARISSAHSDQIRAVGAARFGRPAIAAGLAVLRAYKADISEGFIGGLKRRLDLEFSADRLADAKLLAAEGTDTARALAAILAGIVLEWSLRRWCDAQFPPIETVASDGQPIKADAMVTELSRDERVLSKTDAKHARAVLGVRNDAAHGHWAGLTTESVCATIDQVAALVRKYP